MCIVRGWMDVGNGMKTAFFISWYAYVCLYLCIHACVQCAFMPAVVFVRRICMCVWILFTAIKKKKRKALRPAASWSNWHVNQVSVGWISVCVCVCVCERSVTYLQRQRVTAGVLSSSPTLPWREDGVSLSWREIGCQESEPSPNKTLQHVCGNEDLCFCVRVICHWPPPTSLLTWLSFFPLLMFGCFLFFLPPYAVSLKAIRKKKEESHTLFTLRTPVSHGRMTS